MVAPSPVVSLGGQVNLPDNLLFWSRVPALKWIMNNWVEYIKNNVLKKVTIIEKLLGLTLTRAGPLTPIFIEYLVTRFD